MIKRFFSLLLPFLLAFFLFAEHSALAEAEPRTFDGKVLATVDIGATEQEILYFFTEQLKVPIAGFLVFPSMTEALLSLKMKKVDTLLITDSAAAYIASTDDTLLAYMDPRLKDFADISLSMLLLSKNAELGQAIDLAIDALRQEGVIDSLAGMLFGGEPPEVPEAQNTDRELKVGVTGDIPPVDYVDAMGRPSGYNVSLMRFIGEKIGASIAFVPITKAAAASALITGRIDVLFWQEQSLSSEITALVGALSDLVFITQPYLTLSVTALEQK